MQIHGVPPSQTLRFDFASDSQRQALLSRLSRGETLEARVLDRLNDGRWAIRFFGHNLVAESHLSLLPGQIVRARVESLGPPLVLSLLGGAGSEGASIARALQDLGLMDDNLNRAVVKGLIARGLPVDRRNVQALRDLLLGLGVPLNLENLDALEEMAARALFLRARGLPITPDTLNAYLSHLPAGALGGVLEGLADLLRGLRLPGFQKARLEALADRIAQAIPRAGNLSGAALKRLVDGLGLDLEGRLATWMAGGSEGLPEGLEASLKPALLRLLARLENLDPAGLDAAGRRSLDALLARLQEALRFLDTHQAAGLPASGREALQLQLPLRFDGETATADLRLFYHRGEDGRRRIDPDNLRLSLALELTGLGPVRIDLAVSERRAVCSLQAEDERRVAFLQEVAGELKDALEGCGYAISGITCRRLADREADGDGDHPPPVGLDLRV